MTNCFQQWIKIFIDNLKYHISVHIKIMVSYDISYAHDLLPRNGRIMAFSNF